MEEEKKEHEHEEHHEHTHKKNMTEKIRENPWMLSTFICGILAIILLVSMFSGNITGGVISSGDAGTKLLGFYQAMGIQNLTLNSIKEVSGVYEVDLNYQGKVVPTYITKDGKNVISSLTSITPTTSSSNSNTQQANIPKTDKPVVELYVFAYCPYGLQMEKAILPVLNLFGNQITPSIRYIGDMHDPQGCSGSACFEKTETERQLCIEKNYPTKYLSYISAFASNSAIGSCSGDATCLAPLISSIYSTLGIDSNTINSCMTSEGDSLFNAEVQNSQSVGVSGSPTLIINGVNAQADRSPESIKGVICSAFNNVPSACSQTLDTNQASPGFGGSSSSSSSSSAAACGPTK